jgi:hypothetical protein
MNGRIVGGMLPDDTDTATMLPTGYTFGGSTGVPNYLYLCQPYGLPRWCKYGSGAVAIGLGGRAPGRFKGMPVISTQRTANMYPNAIGAVIVPSAWDGAPNFSGADAVAVWSFLSAPGPALPKLTVTDGEATWIDPAENSTTGDVAASVSNSTFCMFDFDSNVHFPDNAKAIWVRMQIFYSTAAPPGGFFGFQEVFALQSSNNNRRGLVHHSAIFCPIAGAYNGHVLARIPLNPISNTAGTVTYRVEFRHNAISVAGYGGAPDGVPATIGRVVGWETGSK